MISCCDVYWYILSQIGSLALLKTLTLQSSDLVF